MSDDTKIEHPAVHTSAHADLLRQLDDAVRQTQGLPRLPILLREARAAIAQMAEERETLRETAHYANGTAELAMKHRDMAEAQLSEAQSQIGILDHVVAAIGRVLCDEPVSDFDQSYAEVRGVADLKAKLREAQRQLDEVCTDKAFHALMTTDERVADLQEQLREAEARLAKATEDGDESAVMLSQLNDKHFALQQAHEAVRAPLLALVAQMRLLVALGMQADDYRTPCQIVSGWADELEAALRL